MPTAYSSLKNSPRTYFKVGENQAVSTEGLGPLPICFMSSDLLRSAHHTPAIHGSQGCRDDTCEHSGGSCLWAQGSSLAYSRRLISVCRGVSPCPTPVTPPAFCSLRTIFSSRLNICEAEILRNPSGSLRYKLYMPQSVLVYAQLAVCVVVVSHATASAVKMLLLFSC